MRNIAARRLRPFLRESLRINAAALETGAMPGSKRSHLVEEKQVGVAGRPPHIVAPPFELEHAADPLARSPAPLPQTLVITMEAPAAVAEHRAARRRRDQLAERRDAILQRHVIRASSRGACEPAGWRRAGRMRGTCPRVLP